MTTSRRFNLPDNKDKVKPCPSCGQHTQFVCKSQQVQEDGCEVWVECAICGCDPHGALERMQSVMGGCDEDNIRMALDCWNDASGHAPVTVVAKRRVCDELLIPDWKLTLSDGRTVWEKTNTHAIGSVYHEKSIRKI